MKKTFKQMMFAHMALSVAATVTLGISLFSECSAVTQLSLLIQAVGFAFVSGAYFDARQNNR